MSLKRAGARDLSVNMGGENMITVLGVNLWMGDHQLVALLKIMQIFNPLGIERGKAGQGCRVISADGDTAGHVLCLTSVFHPVYGLHNSDGRAVKRQAMFRIS